MRQLQTLRESALPGVPLFLSLSAIGLCRSRRHLSQNTICGLTRPIFATASVFSGWRMSVLPSWQARSQ